MKTKTGQEDASNFNESLDESQGSIQNSSQGSSQGSSQVSSQGSSQGESRDNFEVVDNEDDNSKTVIQPINNLKNLSGVRTVSYF